MSTLSYHARASTRNFPDGPHSGTIGDHTPGATDAGLPPRAVCESEQCYDIRNEISDPEGAEMTVRRWRIVQWFVFLSNLGFGIADFIQHRGPYSIAFIGIGVVGLIVTTAIIVTAEPKELL